MKFLQEDHILLVKDMFRFCTGFDMLADNADKEILKRKIKIGDDYYIVLNENETCLNREVHFKYKNYGDNYRYVGFMIK